MSTIFLYPQVSTIDDIRGTRKTIGEVVLSEGCTHVVVSDNPIDSLKVQLPEPSSDTQLTITAVVKVWLVDIQSSQPVLSTSQLELDFGSSIQLNYSHSESCWVLVRSM